MPELRVALLAVTVRTTNRKKGVIRLYGSPCHYPITLLDQLKEQTGSLLQAMHKINPGIKLTITRVLAFSDIREWQGTFTELPLNRDYLLFKVELKDLSQAQLTALFKNAA